MEKTALESNKVFIVFQTGGKNGLFLKESKAGFIEAPKKDKSGKTPHHWKKMEDVDKGDLIFHMSKQCIVAVSIAKGKYHDDSDGTHYIVDSEYTILENKLELATLRAIIINECKNIKNAPFNVNGTGNQGYLFDMPQGLTNIFIDEILLNNQSQKLDFLKNYKAMVTGNNSNNTSEVTSMNNKNKKISLNTILYGPPGTGKTYNTKYYAVAICDFKGNYEDAKKHYPDYKKLVERYDQLVRENRIAFTTFHQSYGYEEFIEGIKPVLKGDDSKDVYYDVVPGVFKRFCETALTQTGSLENLGINPNGNIWKIIIGKDNPNIKSECFKEDNIRIDFANNPSDSSVKILYEQMKKGDIVVSVESLYKTDGIAIIDDEEAQPDLKDKTEYKRHRNVKWIFNGESEDFKDINCGIGMTRPTITGMPNINRTLLMNLIRKHLKNDNELKPCVFIIDEINRGNISKIFGELITLIESSKRSGKLEGMSCVLPYSKTPFSVPDNVYILGTMNTADRSIALMDTALRRRFDFVEMMPDLAPVSGIVVDGIDIPKMLETLNARIEVLYDREHTLGHAFFMPLKDKPELEVLESIFENKIIPLLQEYFYEDYERIQLVLGDNEKVNEQYKFIKDIEVKTNTIFKGKFNNDDLPDKKYVVNSEALKYPESYKKIYE